MGDEDGGYWVELIQIWNGHGRWIDGWMVFVFVLFFSMFLVSSLWNGQWRGGLGYSLGWDG